MGHIFNTMTASHIVTSNAVHKWGTWWYLRPGIWVGAPAHSVPIQLTSTRSPDQPGPFASGTRGMCAPVLVTSASGEELGGHRRPASRCRPAGRHGRALCALQPAGGARQPACLLRRPTLRDKTFRPFFWSYKTLRCLVFLQPCSTSHLVSRGHSFLKAVILKNYFRVLLKALLRFVFRVF